MFLNIFFTCSTVGNVRVTMGVHDPTNRINTQSTTAVAIAFHPNYKEPPRLLKDDLAVIRLATPIDVISQSNVGVACLPPAPANGGTSSPNVAAGTR